MQAKIQAGQSADTLKPVKSERQSNRCTTGMPGIRLVNKYEVAAILGISPETLKKYRLQDNSPLIEGIHYHAWNSRTIRYNPELMADWALNRNNPQQHQRTIEAYLASLPCNQKKQSKPAIRRQAKGG